MRSSAVAEWILSLVMTRERAAAAVGDLEESYSGPLNLWVSVLHTFFGSLCRQLFEPAEMASVVKDFVLTAADLTARYALRCLFPFLILYVVISVWPQWPTGWGIAALLGTLLRLAITLIVPWKTGRLVAERHPGKELPAFVTIYVAALALIELSSALGIPGYSIVSAEPWVVLRWNEIPTPWNPALMLFSMVLVRHRFLRNEVTPA